MVFNLPLPRKVFQFTTPARSCKHQGKIQTPRSILVNYRAEVLQKADDLEGPGLTQVDTSVCGQRGDVLAKKLNSTLCGGKLSIDEIEKRGLPRAIGSDDGQALSNVHGKCHVVHRTDAAESLGQSLNS